MFINANRSQHITVTLAVESVNDAPVAASDHYGAWKNRTLQIDASQGLISNDHDPEGDSLSVTLATNAAHGQVLLHGDGSFEYTPNPDYVGNDVFAYQLTDGIHTSASIPVEIAVQPLNDTLVNATKHKGTAKSTSTSQADLRRLLSMVPGEG